MGLIDFDLFAKPNDELKKRTVLGGLGFNNDSLSFSFHLFHDFVLFFADYLFCQFQESYMGI